MTEALGEELHDRGIPYRNEQDSQDLAAEPVAALIFNFVWVVAGDRRPAAYAELMRVASRLSATDEAALQFDSQLKRLLRETRATVGSPSFARGDLTAWRQVISEFLGSCPDRRSTLCHRRTNKVRGSTISSKTLWMRSAENLPLTGIPSRRSSAVRARRRSHPDDPQMQGPGVREGSCAWCRRGALLG